MLLSYFNLCQAEPSGRGWRAFTTGNCCGRMHSTALCCSQREREKDRATEPVPRKHRRKNDRAASFCSCFFCAFHSSRINFLCFFLTLISPDHSSRSDALGSFYFARALTGLTRARVACLTGKTTRAHLTFINKTLRFPPGRSTSMHFPRSLLLTSLFFFFSLFSAPFHLLFSFFRFFVCSVRTFRYVSNARVIARESPRFVHGTANHFVTRTGASSIFLDSTPRRRHSRTFRRGKAHYTIGSRP